MIEKHLLYTKSLDWDFRPIDINWLVLDSWRLARSAIPARRISFRADLGKNLPKAFGSHENLRRVFFNLFLNAIQAVGKKGKVMVRTNLHASRDMLQIEVIDDGGGIPEEYRDKIFTPYFTTKKGGEGIGLYISNLIVGEHQGLIEIDSAGEKGTKVRVILPRMSDFKNHASGNCASPKIPPRF